MEHHLSRSDDGAKARTSPLVKMLYAWIGSVALASVISCILILNGHSDIGIWITPAVAAISSTAFRIVVGRYTKAQAAAGDPGEASASVGSHLI